MRNTKQMVLSAMLAALGVVVMIIGGVIGIGTYAAPMIAGIMLLPLKNRGGVKWQLAAWIVTSLVSWMVVGDREEVLMYACIFGWYPIARPALQRLSRVKRIAVKLIVFNVILIAVEALVMLVLVPETESAVMLIVLLLMFNFVFILFDRLLPKAELIIEHRLLKNIR